ncbi:MAG: heat shock protein HspQ [Candidatus Latescibacterota bacterium]|nr:heat shock protein HspQ [Candidatus Latescibacterota bacterium]
MVDKEQIRHLLALLDDDSERVRVSVKAAFESFGEDLDSIMESAGASDKEKVAVQALLEDTTGKILFWVGQLIKHKRYGYRGVVVSVDEECKADEDWHKSNQTQPKRNQPWYYVLADGSDQVFYPAQSSLVADSSEDAIQNPFVDRFFDTFADGVYVRNNRPWPDGE